MTKRTRTCGKTRYRDEIAAKLALSRVGAGGSAPRGKEPQRVYFHHRCRGWHMTSADYNPRVEVEVK